MTTAWRPFSIPQGRSLTALAMNMLTTKALTFAEMETYLVDCTTALLAAYDHQVELAEGAVADNPGPSVMSVIGFATKGVRGSLLLLSPRNVVVELVPAELERAPAPMEHLLRDVLGEFANMLAGRLRNRLISHGIDLLVSMPTTVLGDDLVVPAPKSGIRPGTGSWATTSTSSCDSMPPSRPTSPWPPPRRPTPPPFREGEMVLF